MQQALYRLIAFYGILLSLLLLLGIEHWQVFVDLPLLLLCLMIIVLGGVGSYGLQPLADGLRLCLGGCFVGGSLNGPQGEARLQAARRAWTRMQQLCLPVGGALALIMAIGILHNIDDPGAVGMGLAVALLGPLYAWLLEVSIFGLVAHSLPQTLPNPTAETPADHGRWWGPLAVAVVTLSFFLLMLASQI